MLELYNLLNLAYLITYELLISDLSKSVEYQHKCLLFKQYLCSRVLNITQSVQNGMLNETLFGIVKICGPIGSEQVCELLIKKGMIFFRE